MEHFIIKISDIATIIVLIILIVFLYKNRNGLTKLIETCLAQMVDNLLTHGDYRCLYCRKDILKQKGFYINNINKTCVCETCKQEGANG